MEANESGSSDNSSVASNYTDQGNIVVAGSRPKRKAKKGVKQGRKDSSSSLSD
jgi:hypothetical protein